MVALTEAQRLAADLIASADRTLGADAPDLSSLAKLLQPFAQTSLEFSHPSSSQLTEPTLTVDEAPSALVTSFSTEAHDTMSASSPKMDRWNVLAIIQEARIWFEQNEPSSPVIVLLRQSERMVGKRFSELAHIIPGELLAQWDAIDV